MVGAFSASGITFIKLMGVGMIVALLVDATVVRVLLVPATMRLLGRLDWWAPRPLRRLYARYGIKEEIPGPAPCPPASKADGRSRPLSAERPRSPFPPAPFPALSSPGGRRPWPPPARYPACGYSSLAASDTRPQL